MMKVIKYIVTLIATIAINACSEQKQTTPIESDGFDYDFCQKVRFTATLDIDTTMISKMVEQVKILKPQFEPGTSNKFKNEEDSVTRQQAYDDVSGKLYELALYGRIDKKLIDEVNGYEAVPDPEED